MVQRNILTNIGNSSKVLMCLELGVIPVKLVIIEKWYFCFKYILDESISSLIWRCMKLKEDSRNKWYCRVRQMHVGKKLNSLICTTCKVDAWDEAVLNRDGIIHIEDKYIGEEAIKKVQ